MRRLYIIVEGQTEEEFVKELLMPYLFEQHKVYDVRPIKISTSKTSKGGFVNYHHLYRDAILYLKSEKNIVVTTFVDFFRMPTSLPSYSDCMNKNSVEEKIDCLQEAMQTSIDYDNFIPYIQKFEFETLLFADNVGFEELYEESISIKTKEIIDNYDNPEDINSHPNTAPSKRIIKIMEENEEKYNKVIDGNMIALEVGFEKILEKCPRFKVWIEKLIIKVKA